MAAVDTRLNLSRAHQTDYMIAGRQRETRASVWDLCRSLGHMVKTIADLQARQINLKSLREGIDFATATGRLQAAIFSAMAEYERDLIKERAAAAREAAQARGKQVGRPPALTSDQGETARTMRTAGIDITTIAKTLRCPRATVYRYTKPSTL